VVILAGARARLESDAQAQVCQIRFLCHPPKIMVDILVESV